MEGNNHPGSENLILWKPGQSGNPKGRPVGSKNRSTLVKRYLEAISRAQHALNPLEIDLADLKTLTVEEHLVLAQIAKANTGDTNAFRELMDSAYGKNPDVVISDPAQVEKVYDFPETPEEAFRLYQEALKE